jgi:hypothetical protein
VFHADPDRTDIIAAGSQYEYDTVGFISRTRNFPGLFCPMVVRYVLLVTHPRKEVLASLAAFIEGQSHGEEAVDLILHLSTCPRCRKVVSEVVLSRRDLLDDRIDDSALE